MALSPVRIAVVIPCDAKHLCVLADCLESITTQQSSRPDQIVVSVSDLQPTSPKFILLQTLQKKYPNVTFIVVAHKQLAGRNRNVGAEACSDDIDVICFIDADDLTHPHKIEIVRSTFTLRPELQVFFHNLVRTPWESQQLDEIDVTTSECKWVSGGDIKKYTTVGWRWVVPMPEYENRIHHGHICVRKNVLQSHRYDDNRKGDEDSQFAVRLVHALNADGLIYCSYPFTYYRRQFSTRI